MRCCFGWRIAWLIFVQELFLFLLLLSLFWPLGIHSFHLAFFLRRKLGKVPDEVNELPAVFVVLPGLIPGRHSGESNAVLDCVVEFSVIMFWVLGCRISGT